MTALDRLTVEYASLPAGFCLACGSPLLDAGEGRCPACGRRFERYDTRTYAPRRPAEWVLRLRQGGLVRSYNWFLFGALVVLIARGRLVGISFVYAGALLVLTALAINVAAHAVRWRLSDRDGSTIYRRPTARKRRALVALAGFFAVSTVYNIPERVVSRVNEFAFHHAYFIEPAVTANRKAPGYFGVMWADSVYVAPSGIVVYFRYDEAMAWRPDGETFHCDASRGFQYWHFPVYTKR